MATDIHNITAADMRKLAAERLAALEGQRARARNFRENKAMTGMRRLAVYVPGDRYDECRAAIAAILATAPRIDAPVVDAGVMHNDGTVVAPIERKRRKVQQPA